MAITLSNIVVPRSATDILIFVISIFLVGCSSGLLSPLTEAPTPNAVLRTVTSASKPDSGDYVSVCVTVANPSTKEERAYTFDIPLKNHKRWEIKEVETLNKVQRTLINYTPTLADLSPGCTVHRNPLSMLRFNEDDYRKQAHQGSSSALVKLGNGVSESFYLVNRYYGQLVSVGYATAKPIFNNSYAIGISFDRRFAESLAACGQLLTIEERVSKGEDVNAKASSTKWTALHCAARESDERRTKWLLERNAKVNAKTDKGATPLILASATDNAELVKLLIKNNADVNATSSNGATPLLVAARFGYTGIVKALLENGADIKRSDPHGDTAWAWAQRNKHEEILRLLEKYGCCAK